MATPTPINHPQRAAQTRQFYPFSVTFKATAANGVAMIVSGPHACAYDPAAGGEAGTFQDEAATQDRILIAEWLPVIKPKQLAILDLNGTPRRFEVVDVLPVGEGPDETLITVTPKP